MIKRLEINSPKIKKDRKFLLISDIHKHNKHKDNLKYLKEDLKEEFSELDYIIITGDIIDSPKHLVEEKFIQELKKYIEGFIEDKQTLTVLGNHDITESPLKEEYLFTILNSIDNLKCLSNEDIIDLDDITIQGFTPNKSYYEAHGSKNELEKQFQEEKTSKFNKNKYNILMTHDPISMIEITKDKKLPEDIDLVVTGHMHNGLVPNFLQTKNHHRGIVGPYKRILPNYAYGTLDVDNTKFIILGAVNPIITTPPINKLYGYDATILTLKKGK